MKKIIAILLTVAAGALLTGCGGGGSSNNNNNRSPSTATLPSPEVPIYDNGVFKYEIMAGSTVTIRGYTDSRYNVVIPAEIDGLPVTAIGDRAFLGEMRIRTVVIPDTVTWIGERAFSMCADLESIEIPESVTHIGDSAFRACVKLTATFMGQEFQSEVVGQSDGSYIIDLPAEFYAAVNRN
jgi:hypothetical protein